MSDFADRLAALDPAAGQPYQHRNLDALISRVTAEPRRAPRRLWRSIELKVAASLVVVTAVAAGAIAILQGGPALAPLAIQNTNTKFAVASPYKSATIELNNEYKFSAGEALATATPSADSYRLTVPSNSARETAHLASIFHVYGSMVNSTTGNDAGWTVNSATGASLEYQSTGVPQWYYSSTSPVVAPATEPSTPVNPLPSQKTVAADAKHYLSLLGFRYRVTSPNFSTSATSTTAAKGTGHVTSITEDVTYTVVVDGITTDQTVSFSVGAHNVLAYASGPAIDAVTPYSYPLESPAAGVAQLNVAQKDRFALSTSRPAVKDVALDQASLTLQTYELKNGTRWFLPVYHYEGVVKSTTDRASTGTWNELAIEPSYVKDNTSATDDVTP
jgi:hypothetical protein